MATGRRGIPGAKTLVDDALIEGEVGWRTPRSVGTAFLVVPPAGAVAMMLIVFYRPLFRWLTREDGILEWSQFAADVIALVCAVWAVTILVRRRDRTGALLWLAFAGALLFIAGEEISWGQRVLGHETPDVLASRNHQNESNIHNIRVVQDSINVGFMLVGLYGSVIAVALRRRLDPARRPRWFDLVVPPMILAPAFALVFGYKLLRLVVLQAPRFTIVKSGEYIELCTAVALASFAALTVRRLRGPETTTDPATVIDLRDPAEPHAPAAEVADPATARRSSRVVRP